MNRLPSGLMLCEHSSESMHEIAAESVPLVIAGPLYFPDSVKGWLYGGDRSGMKPEEVESTIKHIVESCPRVMLEGLMTMAPFSENPEDARPYFRRLREMRDDLESRLGVGLPRLSMGMSGDYEVAVEEGATWVRLGTVLFGERPKVKRVAASEGDDGTTPGGDTDTYAGFGGLDSYSGAGPTAKVLD